MDGAMLSIGGVPLYGWIVGLSYFAIDAGITIITNKSIGDYLDEYLHERMDVKDGVLKDLSPYLNNIFTRGAFR